jgi:hypothetical protein
LSPHIARLFSNLPDTLSASKEESSSSISESAISVHPLTKKAGVWYEKVRNLLDYGEEHTLRRRALERILKRRLTFGETRDFGVAFLQELVSAGYLPNNRVSPELGEEVEALLQKFLVLGEAVQRTKGVNISYFKRHWVSLAATELHDLFYPQAADELVVEAFYETLRGNVQYPKDISREQGQVFTYIGCRRTLLKNSDAEIAYALWLRELPEWASATPDSAAHLSERAVPALERIGKFLKHPLSWQATVKLKNHGLYFHFVREIVNNYGVAAESIFNDEDNLNGMVKKSLEQKYHLENNQIKKSGVRAVTYIFLTKIVLAFVFELPYDRFYVKKVDYLALGINVAFHPFLLYLMTRSIGTLGEDNTKRVISGVQQVVYGHDIESVRVKPRRSGTTALEVIFLFFYTALFAVSFGAIVTVLQLLHFNIVSMGLFLFFLTLVSYFGWRVRHNAKRWKVEVKSDSTLALLAHLFTFPIVRAGRWLSRRFASINVVVLFMDFVLETPFKALLSGFDAFLSFIKDKQEEIY